MKVFEADVNKVSFAVAVTVFAPPAELAGTLKDVVKKPVASVMTDARMFGAVPKVMVTLYAFPVGTPAAGKPYPFTVTVVPIGPLVGLIVIDWTTFTQTTKTTRSLSTMVMLCRPKPVIGTVVVALKYPVLLAERPAEVMSIVLSHLSDTAPG